MQCPCDGAAVLVPDIMALKYGPGPSGPVVWLCAVHHPTLERNHKIGDVECGDVHDVQSH